MKRISALLLVLVLLVGLSAPAYAAETVVTIPAVGGTVEMPDGFFLITANNLKNYPAVLTNMGLSTEEEYWQYCALRGVVAQGWNSDKDISITVYCTQDSVSSEYVGLKECTNKQRRAYVSGYKTGEYGEESDLSFNVASWYDETKSVKYVLWLKYAKALSGGKAQARGHQMRTVYNGFSVLLDYRSYSDRKLVAVDGRAIKEMAKSLRFDSEKATGVTTQQTGITLTGAEPSQTAEFKLENKMLAETNQPSFKIVGTGTPQAKITASCSLASDTAMTPIEFTETISSTGTFTLLPQLTEQGIWLINLTVSRAGLKDYSEDFYIEYKTNLLALTFYNDFPETVTESTFKVFGAAPAGTRIDVMLNESYIKNLRVGSTGEFTCPIDVSTSGDYKLVLTFSLAGYPNRIIERTFTSAQNEEDLRQSIRENSTSPLFEKLMMSLDAYNGYTLWYTGSIRDVGQYDGRYSAILEVHEDGSTEPHLIRLVSDENLGFATNQMTTVYGKLIGSAPRDDAPAPSDSSDEAELTPAQRAALLESQVYPLLEVIFSE
ncbi:MAG: hypothetical protein PHI27_01295 [Eubacteriales bacterium]|nr:hypothetical protein [Eubacteriales bacterium]MDD3880870.1 hypothetical protein [Eubacteriales bacterium]MDD4511763.1 hypothetical protein [Eubacteriales bacterium]